MRSTATRSRTDSSAKQIHKKEKEDLLPLSLLLIVDTVRKNCEGGSVSNENGDGKRTSRLSFVHLMATFPGRRRQSGDQKSIANVHVDDMSRLVFQMDTTRLLMSRLVNISCDIYLVS